MIDPSALRFSFTNPKENRVPSCNERRHSVFILDQPHRLESMGMICFLRDMILGRNAQ